MQKIILLVEDNPGDVRLTRESLKDSKIDNTLHVVSDGESALRFLRHENDFVGSPVPDLVFLDLNLPGIKGQEVLGIIKADPILKTIPVVILTASQAAKDVAGSYDNYANCYVCKPLDFEQFVHVVNSLADFWFAIVKLPSREEGMNVQRLDRGR